METLRKISIPPEDFFVECKFQNKLINCTSSFKEDLVFNRICYTFNGLEKYRQDIENRASLNWSIDGNYQPNAFLDTYPHRATGVGIHLGLSILLKHNKQNVDYSCTGGSGVSVEIT
jgi:hypothetical protein